MGQPASSAPFGVVEIKSEHDVATELALSPPKCRMLESIAAASGEVPFSWDDFARRRAMAKTLVEAQTIDDAREAVVDLINDGYLREREYHTSGGYLRSVLRLTDKGRSVVAELEKYKLTPGTMKPISRDELVEIKKEIT
jgi:hypothetical protein